MYQKPPGLDAALSRDGVPPVRVSLITMHWSTQMPAAAQCHSEVYREKAEIDQTGLSACGAGALGLL